MQFPAFLQGKHSAGWQEEMKCHIHLAVVQLLLLFCIQINEKSKTPTLQGSQTHCTIKQRQLWHLGQLLAMVGWLTIDSLSQGTFFSGCAVSPVLSQEIMCIYIAHAFWASALGRFCVAIGSNSFYRLSINKNVLYK